MQKKSFAIIGLGRFGLSVAKTLYDSGYEVVGIDSDPELIQDYAEQLTHTVQADATDELALKDLGIRNFDVVVVAIGQDIQASILTTLMLKELGVRYIVVKAQNERHGKVLYKIGADKVVFPERDMGVRVAHNLISPNILDFIELAQDYSIMEIMAPSFTEGKTLIELNFRARFGVNVMAIKSGNRVNVAPGGEDRIQKGDILVVIGHNDDIKKLEQAS
ncbi:potassium channel family protein [Thermicanus aegyptius]|uniref:potassium channel family protein n=1 Tax=Thermicanus aegyptius TaxID=94009 RepID=UPI00048FFD23|nr:TrkA family potassium uptake protein [Thermicanus aegyptius]